MTAFDDFCTDGEYTGYYWYSPPDTVPAARVVLLGELVHEHPYYVKAVHTQDENVFRTSDQLPLSKFHRTELYNEFYRIFDGEAQMISAMRLSPTSLVTCSIHRPKIDFTDSEVEMLTLLTPHLRTAFKIAQAFERLNRERKYLSVVVNRGVAVIDGDGKLIFINEIAETLLALYFCDFSPDRLPDLLQRYIEAKCAEMDGLDYYAPCESFRVKRNNAELVIHLAFDVQAKELTLLFEEKVERSIVDFNHLGLTPREAEILMWMSRGKTDSDISLLCDISVRTVQKHAEHVYTKLGVETRTAAVIAALERFD